MLVTGMSALACAILVVVGRPVITSWLNDSLTPPQSLIIAMAFFTTFSLASAPLALCLNAIGQVRIHAWLAIAVGVTNLPLSWLLTHQVGIAGPVIGSLATNFCLATIPAAIVVTRILRRAAESAGSADQIASLDPQ